jgi:hypothetical protein
MQTFLAMKVPSFLIEAKQSWPVWLKFTHFIAAHDRAPQEFLFVEMRNSYQNRNKNLSERKNVYRKLSRFAGRERGGSRVRDSLRREADHAPSGMRQEHQGAKVEENLKRCGAKRQKNESLGNHDLLVPRIVAAGSCGWSCRFRWHDRRSFWLCDRRGHGLWRWRRRSRSDRRRRWRRRKHVLGQGLLERRCDRT